MSETFEFTRGRAHIFGHKHPEAFHLMVYKARDNTACQEVIWNSRDGATPFSLYLACGCLAYHARSIEVYMPEHVPKVGSRIFVDLHPERAVEIATRKVDEHWDHPTYPMAAVYPDKRTAIDKLWRSFCWPGAPDLVEVTPFLRERFTAPEAVERAAELARRARDGWAILEEVPR